jgi:hypothetical protein
MKLIQLSNEHSINYPIGVLYLEDNLVIVTEMAQKLQDLFGGRTIALWCRGSSGAIISGIIASKIPIHSINHVKKEGEDSHSGDWHRTECNINVIVDDFIKSGETVNAIYNKMKYKGISVVDCLCVSSYVYKERLAFTPNYIIAHRLKS